jgi:hypothetical protein
MIFCGVIDVKLKKKLLKTRKSNMQFNLLGYNNENK